MSARPTELRLDEGSAQAVVLVRAVEEVDPRGRLLSLQDRRAATREARKDDEKDWLGRRARLLLERLEASWSFLPRLLHLTIPGRGLLVPSVLVALGVGLATNALGPERRIQVLALPLLTLLVWNLAVFALLALHAVLPHRKHPWRRPALLGVVERLARHAVERLPPRKESEADLLPKALSRYFAAWTQTQAPLAAARLRRLLHLSAFTAIAGAVAGMYLRGLVFAYQATWESTFLTDHAVDGLLGFVLGPAATILGIDLPPAAILRSPAAGDAAPWIHVWAMTAAYVVAVPRLLLALLDTWRVARLRRRLPVAVDEVYVRKILAAASAATHRIDVVPYSYRPAAAVTDALRTRLLDVFGAESDIRLHPPKEYGDIEVDLAGGRAWIVVFNLAQTPEAEVHGEVLKGLLRKLPDGTALLALVEGSVLRERLPAGEAGERRWDERRRSWDRLAQQLGLRALHLDLRRDAEDEVVEKLLAAVAPS